jgi:pyruvate kinase
MSRTKIVCTIGPSSRSLKVLEGLFRSGMDVARLNFSHGTHSEYKEVIGLIRKIAGQKNMPIAILQDLAGPKIRIGKVKKKIVRLEPGASFTLTARQVLGNEKEVSISYPKLHQNVQPGDPLLLSDGALELEVQRTSGQNIICRVIVGGPLSSFKGINLPTRSIESSILTTKDRKDLEFGLEQGVDYVALSFVRKVEDIREAKRFMVERGKKIPIIAKIEKHEALVHIDEIIREVDGVMVARGDLGVETPLEKIPMVQKQLIQKSNAAGKPVITATQMLRSMTDNPRPTRAEVTDVANSILDGTDAVMLSEETAVGKYPVEAVAMMAKIAKDAECEGLSTRHLEHPPSEGLKTIPDAVSLAASMLAKSIGASAIITFTRSGATARLVARYRPRCLILAPTPEEKIYRRLALVRGVVPILTENIKDTDEMTKRAIDAAQASGHVQKGQKVVITAGVPFGVPGTTNMIKVEEI